MSLELVKVMQCLFVDWDRHMYSPEADRPALARTSGLLEELGQVRPYFNLESVCLIFKTLKCSQFFVLH